MYFIAYWLGLKLVVSGINALYRPKEKNVQTDLNDETIHWNFRRITTISIRLPIVKFSLKQ